jgi:hypothetical protein
MRQSPKWGRMTISGLKVINHAREHDVVFRVRS